MDLAKTFLKQLTLSRPKKPCSGNYNRKIKPCLKSYICLIQYNQKVHPNFGGKKLISNYPLMLNEHEKSRSSLKKKKDVIHSEENLGKAMYMEKREQFKQKDCKS